MLPESPPEQLAQRPGEILGAHGRWNAAALRHLEKAGRVRPTWTKGAIANVASVDGTVIGDVHRHRPEHPWVLRIQGFEFWQPPTRIIARWHYSPAFAVANLRQAKQAFEQVFLERPEPENNPKDY